MANLLKIKSTWERSKFKEEYLSLKQACAKIKVVQIVFLQSLNSMVKMLPSLLKKDSLLLNFPISLNRNF